MLIVFLQMLYRSGVKNIFAQVAKNVRSLFSKKKIIGNIAWH